MFVASSGFERLPLQALTAEISIYNWSRVRNAALFLQLHYSRLWRKIVKTLSMLLCRSSFMCNLVFYNTVLSCEIPKTSWAVLVCSSHVLASHLQLDTWPHIMTSLLSYSIFFRDEYSLSFCRVGLLIRQRCWPCWEEQEWHQPWGLCLNTTCGTVTAR